MNALVLPKKQEPAAPYIDNIKEILRDYQSDIFQLMVAAYKTTKPHLNNGLTTKDRCNLVVLPTGMGKTFCFAATVAALYAEGQAKRVLFLAHKEELCLQIVETLKFFGFPSKKIDTVIQSEPRNRQITVGTVQSFTAGNQWRLQAIIAPDVAIIDEAHRSAARTYQEAIEAYSQTIFFGFTATPIRTEPEFKKIFVDTWQIIYNEYTLCKAIEDGVLCNLKYYRISLSKLGIPREEQSKYNVGLVNDEIVKKYFEVGGGKFFVFANSVEHSKTLQRVFKDSGVTAYHVDCFTHKKERARILKEFKETPMTDNAVICNFGVYTEGVDVPDLWGVIIACKLSSKSIVRFLQMVGRATRNFEDPEKGLKKEFGIVLEVRNNRSKALADALNKVFRLYYQDVEEYDDHEPEPEETKEEELDVASDLPDVPGADVVGIEDAELELTAFFSPLPQTFIASRLNWASTVPGVYFCHVTKSKFFEVVKRGGGFYVYGVNTQEKRQIAALKTEKDVDAYCFNVAARHYNDNFFVWAKASRKKWENEPATEAQKKILRRNGYDDKMTKAQASRILDMMKEKKRHEPISTKQQRFLYAIGFRGDLSLVNKANVGGIIKQLQSQGSFQQ